MRGAFAMPAGPASVCSHYMRFSGAGARAWLERDFAKQPWLLGKFSTLSITICAVATSKSRNAARMAVGGVK